MRLMRATTAALMRSMRRANSLLVGVVVSRVSPPLIRYVSGGCRFGNIVRGIVLWTFFGGGGQAYFSLQGADCLFEVEHLPESNSQIQDTHAGDCATDPARCDYSLQTIEACLARGVKQEIVVAPIA